jgi:hypothetical protein
MAVPSHVLDTLIVLAALYGGGAVLCSFVSETISSLTQLRGRNLYKGIFNLVCEWPEIIKDVYDHPLVTSGSSGSDPKKFPSYLDARNFSVAFWQSLQQRVGAPLPSEIATAIATPESVLADLKARVGAIDPSTPGLGDLKAPLSAMLSQAGDDYDKLLSLTDDWFNRQMDRIAGWYRRNSQLIVLTLGFILAFALDIDSARVVTRMNANPGLDAKYATAFSSVIDSSTSKPVSSPDPSLDPKIIGQAQALDTALRSTDAGFSLSPFVNLDLAPAWPFLPALRSPGSIIGTAISGFAFALGAPFWFDLLSKFVSVRKSGIKPTDKTKDT